MTVEDGAIYGRYALFGIFHRSYLLFFISLMSLNLNFFLFSPNENNFFPSWGRRLGNLFYLGNESLVLLEK